MIGTAQATVDWCRRWLGFAERPVNRTPFAKMAGHPDGAAWCATFISAAMRQSGVPVSPKILVPSSRTMFAEARKAGYEVGTSLRPGDVVHMTRGSISAWLGHVGIVEKVLDNGPGRPKMVITIEGNTNGKGSATGGAVLRHERLMTAWNLGGWRPPYRIVPATPTDVRFLLELTDGRIVAWDGQQNAAGARVVRHIGTIPEVERLLEQGWKQVRFDGPVHTV